MNQFLSWLDTRKIGYDKAGRPVHALLSPLIYRSDAYGLIEVPVGFNTNFASVPRLPVIFLVAGDRAHEAACVHDYLYTVRSMLGRKNADEIFYEAILAKTMIEEGYDSPVPIGLAKAMYQAVRTFGQGAWDSDTEIRQPQRIRQHIAANESMREAA